MRLLFVFLAAIVCVGCSKSWNGVTVPPKIYVGRGEFTQSQSGGNFILNDTVLERYELSYFEVAVNETNILILNGNCACEESVQVTVSYELLPGGYIEVVVKALEGGGWNRIWYNFEKSSAEEVLYGGGEQFTLNLAGRKWPIWVREQGVGRDSSNPITGLIELGEPGAGGAYHTTYYPVPTFLTSGGFGFVGDMKGYSELNFEDPVYNTVYTHGTELAGKILQETSMMELVKKVTGLYTPPPALPSWTNNGAIIAVQGGTDRMLQILRDCQAQGVEVAGLWIQDWSGKVETSFGYRVFWNWQWNQTLYPGLDTVVEELILENVRVNVYMNPYLNIEGNLFKEADSLGYLLKDQTGQSYIQDFGGFFAGTVDLFYEPAVQWYIDVITRNILDLKFGGFMADFGEYTPTDAQTSNATVAQLSGEERHNLLPLVWSRTVRRALEAAGLAGEVIAWMRSGYQGSQGEQVMVWAGDQNVDWSIGDGLPTVIPAALSLGMSGFGLSHSDIGGYTTFDLVLTRNQELLLRWAELSAFTSLMRTHEGNKPTLNEQVYSSEETLAAFSKMTKVFKALTPYRNEVIRQVVEERIPALRPLFLHYDDPDLYTIETEFMFGEDLLVAPVLKESTSLATVTLPKDTWEYLWEDLGIFTTTTVIIDAPLGKPPVFFRTSSQWSSLFREIKNLT